MGRAFAMFRDDVSPVKDRLSEYRRKYANVSFVGCRNTLDGMSKRESKQIALVGEAIEVATGIGHLIELQEQGWSYIRP
jgi:intracellular sulfur oxidation DsrE/DsrF family protein